MRPWLTLSSLLRRDAAPSDMQFLTEENVDEIGKKTVHPGCPCRLDTCGLMSAGGAMTHVERMRLQAALRALADETPAAGSE